MMNTLRALIVDDDEIDRLSLASCLKLFPEIKICGIFSCAEEALEFVKSENIDILFLDIDMPGMSGLELRKELSSIPVCIFVTSHPEFAVESFEMETLDFIVKPLLSNRFEQTVQRINTFFEIRKKLDLFESSIGGDVIYIKEGHNQIKIKLHDVLYLEALKDYTLVVTEQKRYCVLSSIGQLLKNQSFSLFIRIHRSFAVQKQFVNKINPYEVELRNGIVIPIGRSYKEGLNLIL